MKRSSYAGTARWERTSWTSSRFKMVTYYAIGQLTEQSFSNIPGIEIYSLSYITIVVHSKGIGGTFRLLHQHWSVSQRTLWKEIKRWSKQLLGGTWEEYIQKANIGGRWRHLKLGKIGGGGCSRIIVSPPLILLASPPTTLPNISDLLDLLDHPLLLNIAFLGTPNSYWDQQLISFLNVIWETPWSTHHY